MGSIYVVTSAVSLFFFFFQAEDGIRDYKVTGVQTCALPISARLIEPVLEQAGMTGVRILMALGTDLLGTALARAELDRGTPPGRLAAALLGQLRAARPFGLGSWEQTAARWASWATHWSAASLRAALRLALDADRALKSTTLTDERGILVQLVLALGVLQREAA